MMVKAKQCKYIFVTGGVLSSLGKGVCSAAIALLLKQLGFKITCIKIDPYLNIDPGTMSPLEHGEVFVTEDGAETDLDIGNYERFLDQTFTKHNSITAGQIYAKVIEKERNGEYLGRTIQVVPHIVDEIKHRIKTAARGYDITIVEVGGTVGDIEGLPFYEAVRQIKRRLKSMVFNIHVTLVPYIVVANELKTKPSQHSVKELRRIGINPDMIFCRCTKPLPFKTRSKLADYCNLDDSRIINVDDCRSIYEVPNLLLKQKTLDPILEQLQLVSKHNSQHLLKKWNYNVKKILHSNKSTKVAFVCKYSSKEAYKSLIESLLHAGAAHNAKIDIDYIQAENLNTANLDEYLSDKDGILVPGGFGIRGTEGKMLAIRYAREKQKVFLGICLGLQLCLIEFARSFLRLEDANSTEFDPKTNHPVIYLINQFIDQVGKKQIRTIKTATGGTMRLGNYEAKVKLDTKLYDSFQSEKIVQRHRHRFEANIAYERDFEKAGLIISAKSKGLIEAVELEHHPWFVAVQFHPEFSSSLQNPNPLISNFVRHCLINSN